mgnify:CR=1 FL=1
MGLSAKHEAFCREYIKDFNGTQAAARAGYSERTSNEQSSRLLANANIQARIAELQSERSERVQIDADYVLRRLHEIDQLDVADILTDAGDFLPIKQWPKAWRISLSAIDIQIINSGDTEAITKKVKWPDKIRNLELLGKHIGVNAFAEKQVAQSDDLASSISKLIDKLPS